MLTADAGNRSVVENLPVSPQSSISKALIGAVTQFRLLCHRSFWWHFDSLLFHHLFGPLQKGFWFTNAL